MKKRGIILILLAFVAFAALLYFDRINYKTSLAQNSQVDIESYNWQKICYPISSFRFTPNIDYTNIAPVNCANTVFEFANDEEKGKVLHLKGGKDVEVQLKGEKLDLVPDAKYKVSYWTKIANRTLYDVSQSSMRSSYIENYKVAPTDPAAPAIFGGEYMLYVRESNTNFRYLPATEQKLAADYPYVRYKELPWHYNEATFTVSENATKLDLLFSAAGFLGDIYLSDLKVEKIDSFVTDAQMTTPITHPDMKIKAATSEAIATTGGIFSFLGSSMIAGKDESVYSDLYFGEGFLDNLQLGQAGEGFQIYENDKVKISVGADSVATIKLKAPTTMEISGMIAKYGFIRNGLVFVRKEDLNSPTGLGGGILFSPNLGTVDYRNYTSESVDHLFPYELGYWLETGNTADGSWNVSYDAVAGDTFIYSIFPPKEYNLEKNSALVSDNLSLSMSKYTPEQARYFLQRTADFNDVVVMWMGRYSRTKNYQFENESHASYYDPQSNKLFTDVYGPYEINDVERVKKYIEYAHEVGLKVVLYLGPSFYYTQDVDKIVQNIAANITQTGADGLYYDGYLKTNFSKNLELMRKTRAMLGEKLFIQHQSVNYWFFEDYNHDGYAFRAPFIDAYADIVWLGESARVKEDYAWNNHFSSYNISNSFNTLLLESAPNISLLDQINTQIKNFANARIHTNLNPYESQVVDGDNFIKFNSFKYFDLFRNYYTKLSQNDSQCAALESIIDSRDCSAKETDSQIVQNGQHYEVKTEKDVANFLLNNQPLYDLHYNFNDSIARDISGNKLNPHQNLGIDDGKFKVPQIETVDGRSAAHFTGTESLWEYHGNSEQRLLDLSGGKYSFFSWIKRENTDTSTRVIYNQGLGHFYLALAGDKLVFRARYADNSFATVTSPTPIDNNWHFVGTVVDGLNVKLYIDGQLAKESTIAKDLKAYDDTNFIIGSVGYSGGAQQAPFMGYIDELFLTKTLLSEIQIQALYEGSGKKFVSNQPLKVLLSQNRTYSLLEPEVSLKKQVDKEGAARGDTLNFTLFFNNPTDKTLQNVKISDTLESGLSYEENSANLNGVFSGGKVTWNIESIDPNSTLVLTFRSKVQ